tara:strand:- start:1312 stop:1473 length:162 start_codon:yes stop_codon:yes gene_type:complete
MEDEYIMEIEYMTKSELNDKITEQMKKAKLADKKWIYNYFTGHDEWPIITDEL